MPNLIDAAYLSVLGTTLPFWCYKAATTGKYRAGLREKFLGASFDQQAFAGKRVIWIHAVSVGELLLLRPLLARLEAELPGHQVVLSTTTNTGYETAKKSYPQLPIFYAPLDFTWAVRRVFDQLQPACLVLTELELWPNLLTTARQRGVPVAVVNARMGEKSFAGYKRFLRLFRKPLSAIRFWGAQTETYARRIVELTGKLDVVSLTGSIKYDNAMTERDNPQTAALRTLLGLGPQHQVWVCGSTMEPEEEALIAVYKRLRGVNPNLRWILVPRHKERFEAVAQLLDREGITFTRRSQITEPLRTAPEVLLGDTIGELAAMWGLADVGFTGGSFECRRGGQSMIEPAAYGVPVCFGPNTWNFKATVESLLECNAATVVRTTDEIFQVLDGWLRNPATAREVGQRGRQFILAQHGATERTLTGLCSLLTRSGSHSHNNSQNNSPTQAA